MPYATALESQDCLLRHTESHIHTHEYLSASLLAVSSGFFFSDRWIPRKNLKPVPALTIANVSRSGDAPRGKMTSALSTARILV